MPNIQNKYRKIEKATANCVKRNYGLFCAVFLSCLLIPVLGFCQKARPIQRPNIIFILMDDLGYGDLGVFFQNLRKTSGKRGEPWMLTPNLDSMAYNGAMLTNHYCAAPVCAPSRASLLLGVSQGHANVRDNQFDKALEDNYTIANVLKKAGYRTAAIGKWGLQGKQVNGDCPAHPLKRGFDYFFGYLGHSDGHEHYPKEGLYEGSKKVWENYSEVSSKLDKCYTGDLFTAVAKKYISEQQKSGSSKPFFLYLAYDTPHAVLELPTQAYPKGGGLRGGIQWLGKEGKMINTASGKIDSWIYPEYKNATYDHDNNALTAEIPWPETYQRYATINHRIDEQIGDLIKLLKDLNIDKNTLVVFSSDNGPSKESYLPKSYVDYAPNFFDTFGPFDGIKRDCLEGGIRMPTIAFWPGKILPGTVIPNPSISYDWLPTFAELSGYPAPVRSDGVSLVPSLLREGTQKEGLIYIEYFNSDTTPDYPEFYITHRNKKRNQMQMLRLGNKVGVRFDIKSGDDPFEIYDLGKDPQEAVNLADEQPALQQKFKEKAIESRISNSSAVRPYDQDYIPSLKELNLKPGLHVKLYSGNFPWLPNLEVLKPNAIAFTRSPSTPVKLKSKQNLVLFEGFIKVPEDNEYTFYLSAENKSFLKIHDISVIDEDYNYKPGHIKEARVRLKAGYHPIRIYSLSKLKARKTSINLQWSTPGTEKSAIPNSAFYNSNRSN